MSVLVVGSVALDTVKTPFGFQREVLGGSATYFSMAASFFTKVKVVAVIGTDFDENHFKLFKKRGVDWSGIERKPGKSFRWEGEYRDDINTAITKKTSLNVFREFDPVLPGKYRGSRTVFLANIDPDLQMKVLGQIRLPKLVVCDTMNFWIENKSDSLRKMISHVDILLMNDGEVRQFTGEANLFKAVRAVLKLGPRTVVVKRGEFGAMMFHGNTIFAVPAFPLDRAVDPTGAGDSFAGGFVGYLSGKKALTVDHLRQAVVFGSVMASFAVQGFSIDSFRTLTHEKIRERYRQFKELTSFRSL